ncbi:S41 family peptidase [Chitinophaga jiangningensis]|nr:S41 family peptidase [Chitinophaga jiangningensis]
MFKKFYDTLSAHPGEFVNLFGKDVGITKRDTVYAYPKRVGIIIHAKNGSTTEQFLMAAKQSQKVKFFGRTTHGMLDISNVHIVPSPCKDFELYYGLSRSMRIPDFAIDDIGLQPDYFIDRTVKDDQWVRFVSETLNGRKK